MTGPLSDIRVLDVATFLAAPFCGTILAEFGAEVLKVEQPGEGDALRRFGTPTECGDTFVWMSESRNKKSITLDLRKPEGADLLRRLVAKSDVVLENFRPGTMARWGLGYDALAAINPRIVMLSVSAYGQNGPHKDLPGFARIAHAFSGLAYLAGEPGRPPVVPGSTSLADYTSGLYGAIGVLVALRHAQATGEGQHIDVGLYEPIFRVLDEIAPVWERLGIQRERMGADTINVVPHSHYETSDGQWVAVACSNERMWQRICEAMRRPELATDERYRTMGRRIDARDEVNAIVSGWIGSLTLDEVLAECRQYEVPCSKLLSISDIFEDPQYEARGNLLRVDDARIGPITIPAPMPQMSKTPPQFHHAGPALGTSNTEVYQGLLGISDDELARLTADRVI